MSDEKLKDENLNDTNLEEISQNDSPSVDESSESSIVEADVIKKQNLFQKLGTNIKNKSIDFAHNTKENFVDFGQSVKDWWKRLRSRNFKENMKALGKFFKSQKGWLWLLPAFILLCIFTFFPIVNTLISSFKVDYQGLSKEYAGIGFTNFKTAVTDAYFLTCLRNTAVFAFISVPVSTILALLLSVALSSIKPLQKAYQSIFFLPYLTNALSIGAVFATMFNVIGTRRNIETWGLINTIFGTQIHWVDSKAGTIPMMVVVIVYEIWSGLPFKILILFGALQSVNKQYYDAAKVDGATKATTLWKITVPLISPMISYLVITGFIGAFKSYTAIVGIFGPKMGPKDDYEMGTIVGLIYKYINNGATGVACAASLVLFAMIMVFTLIQMQVNKRKVHF